MGNAIKNVILICALSAVAIMCVGLFLYEYIPGGLEVSKANTYETLTETTKALSDASEAQKLLTEQRQTTTSTSGTNSPVKTNIVLKEYEVSKTDLAIYQQSGDYVRGKANPFAEVKQQEEKPNEDSTSSNENTVEQPSDGTFYNSTKKK